MWADGGGSPRHLNTFSTLFIVAVHYIHQYSGGECPHLQQAWSMK